MRMLVSGILVLLAAVGSAFWPQQATAADDCIFNRVDCGGFTCAAIGYSYTANGGCLAQPEMVVGRECVVRNNNANVIGQTGTTHKAAAARFQCVHPGTGMNIYTTDCGDLYIRTSPDQTDCPKLWAGCGGTIVTPAGC